MSFQSLEAHEGGFKWYLWQCEINEFDLILIRRSLNFTGRINIILTLGIPLYSS